MPRLPVTRLVCTEPGRSIRYAFFGCGAGIGGNFEAGTTCDAHPPKYLFTRARACACVTSPTTPRMALFGANQVSWNFFKSAMLMALTDSGVAEMTAAGKSRYRTE